MIRIIIELIMFGCTVFTIMQIIKQVKYKKQQKSKLQKVPKLSDLKGEKFGDYIEDLRKDLKDIH